MTAVALKPEPVPLVRDDAGRLMIVGTRVPLDTLVAAFKRGEAPEVIHYSYPTVTLADIYSVLAYYLHHRDEVEDYISEREREGEETRARMEVLFPPEEGLLAKLRVRLEK